MNFLLAAENDAAIGMVLLIALIIVSIMLAIALIAATVFRIIIFFNYWVTNRSQTSGGYTGATAARTLLDRLGYTDIQVKRAGFFTMLFYGNHYNPVRKTIYLRRSVYDKGHLTAVGLALQKVGLVVQDKRDGNKYKRRWRLQKIAMFGPILFIPIVIVGVILDFVILFMTGGDFSGLFTLITAVLGVAYFIVCLVLSFRTMRSEGQANRETLEIIGEQDFLSFDEQEKVAKVFKTYELAYITDFIINILQIIKFILQILINIFVKNKN